jgi:hypothetical protein
MSRDVSYVVHPREVVSWNEFLERTRTARGGIVALDGYVRGGPRFFQNMAINFNHHEEVDRLATRSTAAQVFMAIKQGFFQFFGKPIETHVNDCDQDVCLAIWLLRNHERIEGVRSEPLISRLVFALDVLDATGGSYPFLPDSLLMRQLAWIFRPFTSKRGDVGNMDEAAMGNVIDSVVGRISEYAVGEGDVAELDSRHEIVSRHGFWGVVKEIGADARGALFADGLRAFVSFAAVAPTDRFRYSIGKMSPFVPFPLSEIFDALNAAEPSLPEGESWGGSDLIGGSPRKSGSMLPPMRVAEIVRLIVSRAT